MTIAEKTKQLFKECLIPVKRTGKVQKKFNWKKILAMKMLYF